MREALYLATGFAFLTFVESPVSFRPSKAGRALLSFIQTPAEIFFILLLFAALESMAERIMPSPYPGETVVPLLMLGSYAGARFFKKDNTFFLTLLAFGFFILTPEAGTGLPEKIRRLAVMSLTFAAVRFLLEGLRFRLLFASPPKRLAGMPVLIFAFAVLLMALCAVRGLAE